MLHADIPVIRFFLDPEYNEVALISTDGGLYFSDDNLAKLLTEVEEINPGEHITYF